MNNPQLCAMFRTQYAKNAIGLAAMLAKAESTGRKANGFTADQLRERVTAFRRFATLDDEAMCTHLQECQIRQRARLAELSA